MTRRGRKARRLALVAVAGLAIAGAAALVLYGLGDRITYAATPTELKEAVHPAGARIRLGGLVEDGSLVRGTDGEVTFAVTDTVNHVSVTYTGLLPDLFREGQGVVTEGMMNPSGILEADTVLARHDENYMPKEVVDSLKAQGRWKEGEAARTGMEGRARTATIDPDQAIPKE
ncbi:cytochrome c maturation protein CcmE [Acuticoccus sp. I52.16.1]|uniref:cytochrome c maturation protein CcmE n=1 Tax=Acuticoccus sp. I52.16.1 TaxID=2928472 RepID=UPI001FD1B5C6|nr:cytochrome c maturation protein CcmE [Acuticoccus sp. I52.16.1]UOM34248.1 cytochrome c maturation protein CcmE [Acuticoccus sp. I52.16.1]